LCLKKKPNKTFLSTWSGTWTGLKTSEKAAKEKPVKDLQKETFLGDYSSSFKVHGHFKRLQEGSSCLEAKYKAMKRGSRPPDPLRRWVFY